MTSSSTGKLVASVQTPSSSPIIRDIHDLLRTLSLPLVGANRSKSIRNLLTACSIAAVAGAAWWVYKRQRSRANSGTQQQHHHQEEGDNMTSVESEANPERGKVLQCEAKLLEGLCIAPNEEKSEDATNQHPPPSISEPSDLSDDYDKSQNNGGSIEKDRAVGQSYHNDDDNRQHMKSVAMSPVLIDSVQTCIRVDTGHRPGPPTSTEHFQEYKTAQSPTNSEGSADSGRATGRPTSCSPAAALEVAHDLDVPPMYEFEIPNTLVGLIIGIRGKTIRELCMRTDVKMLIRPHFTPSKYNTHQICSVEGRRENINRCLQLIRHRFPQDRFPDLNLRPVLPLPLHPTNGITAPRNGREAPTSANASRPPPTALSLPVGVPSEVYVSAPVDAGHFFCQLPTHPTFKSLRLLDWYMLQLYGNQTAIPELPKPCSGGDLGRGRNGSRRDRFKISAGVLCAAPAYAGWFRAITLLYDEEQDETLVRFVDYGGFAKIPRADLRQIRTDFMSLPLQAIVSFSQLTDLRRMEIGTDRTQECYLAHVQPADGTSHWSEEANEVVVKLCMAKMCQVQLVGYHKVDNIPVVEMNVLDADKNVLRVDKVLLEKGLAKPADPSKVAEPVKQSPAEKSANEERLKKNGHRQTTLPLLLTPPDTRNTRPRRQ